MLAAGETDVRYSRGRENDSERRIDDTRDERARKDTAARKGESDEDGVHQGVAPFAVTQCSLRAPFRLDLSRRYFYSPFSYGTLIRSATTARF